MKKILSIMVLVMVLASSMVSAKEKVKKTTTAQPTQQNSVAIALCNEIGGVLQQYNSQQIAIQTLFAELEKLNVPAINEILTKYKVKPKGK